MAPTNGKTKGAFFLSVIADFTSTGIIVYIKSFPSGESHISFLFDSIHPCLIVTSTPEKYFATPQTCMESVDPPDTELDSMAFFLFSFSFFYIYI